MENGSHFKKAKWIWAKDSLEADDYAEFIGEFSTNKEVNIKISADSGYAIYINDELIKFMFSGDYPYYKFFDEFIYVPKQTLNKIKIQVWHMGFNSSNYINDIHGLIFEISSEKNVLLFSNELTKSRVMNEYKNGFYKFITPQIGLTYYYDNSVTLNHYDNSVLINKKTSFVNRKINNLNLLSRVKTNYINKDDSIIVDLGREWAGFIDLDIDSDIEQEVTISFGEHLLDGNVRRFIDGRDFAVFFKLKKGNNKILPPFRRVAGRYLQIYNNAPIKINYLGIRPVMYENEVIEKKFDDPLLNEIYETCIRTLQMCMHEHYEDCPWREQALYVLDSRNQMLCGHFVFKGHEFQRHNILLIANSLNKKTGLLTLTAPKGDQDYPIPFFSLVLIEAVKEYISYSGDKSLLNEVRPVLDTIVETFTNRIDKHHLIPYFEKPFWNFYEWTTGNSHDEDFLNKENNAKKYDLIINASYVYFVDMYNSLFNEHIDIERSKKAIQEMFFDRETKLFFNDSNKTNFSQLGLAFVSLIGLGNETIDKELIFPTKSTEASLSTRGYIYDALLKINKNNSEFIISDIKARYKKMLDMGATTFYETEEGASSFGGAGSLCHGWSALPIYYLNLFK